MPSNVQGWVLYDGHCGLCSAGMRRLRGLLHDLGYETAPLQAKWVLALLGDAAFDPREMALLTRDGRLFVGVDAYVHMAEGTWWARPFAKVARWPRVDRLLRRAYRFVADRRLRISAACHLRADVPKGGER